jgi:hypothetical protein
VVFEVGKAVGLLAGLLPLPIGIAFLAGLISLAFQWKKKQLALRVGIFFFYLMLGWKSYEITAGLIFIETNSLLPSVITGIIIASLVAAFGLGVLFFKSHKLRTILAVFSIIFVTQIPVFAEMGSQIIGKKNGPERAFVLAVFDGKAEIVRNHLRQGVDPNGRISGLTYLYYAVDKGHIEVVNALLSAGANINAQSGPAARTALHQAVRRGNVELVTLLLKRGANKNITTTHGRTPLDYAKSPPAPLPAPLNADAIVPLLSR